VRRETARTRPENVGGGRGRHGRGDDTNNHISFYGNGTGAVAASLRLALVSAVIRFL
jgi:hypothetical protein